MRIGIDARTILNPERSEGIGEGHYTYQLLRHILFLDKKNTYVLFFDARVREKDLRKCIQPNVSIRFFPFSDYKKYLPVAYSEILGRATLAKEHLDILHSTSPLSRIPFGYRGKSVTTFHNMGIVEHPECYSYARRLREEAVYRYMAKKSDHVIASSRSVGISLRKAYRVPKGKISVVYGGIDKRFFEKKTLPGDVLKSRFSIQAPYILFLGTLSPINNIMRLLEAFAKFRAIYFEEEKIDCPYTLVLAGKRGWLSQEYRYIVRDLRLTKNVVFTGYVVGDDLVPLFRGAEFFVLPSLYEGFGSTVLEAFACGTPAIVSRAGSMPEIAGEGARYVDPINVAEIGRAMYDFSQNTEMRSAYAKKGFEQVRKFSWEKTAQETIAVYEKLTHS